MEQGEESPTSDDERQAAHMEEMFDDELGPPPPSAPPSPPSSEPPSRPPSPIFLLETDIPRSSSQAEVAPFTAAFLNEFVEESQCRVTPVPGLPGANYIGLDYKPQAQEEVRPTYRPRAPPITCWAPAHRIRVDVCQSRMASDPRLDAIFGTREQAKTTHSHSLSKLLVRAANHLAYLDKTPPRSDPQSSWVRDLTEDGIESNPGPSLDRDLPPRPTAAPVVVVELDDDDDEWLAAAVASDFADTEIDSDEDQDQIANPNPRNPLSQYYHMNRPGTRMLVDRSDHETADFNAQPITRGISNTPVWRRPRGRQVVPWQEGPLQHIGPRRQEPIEAPTHVSMDANSIKHGPAANGAGPRTPFAQDMAIGENDPFWGTLLEQLEGVPRGVCPYAHSQPFEFDDDLPDDLLDELPGYAEQLRVEEETDEAFYTELLNSKELADAFIEGCTSRVEKNSRVKFAPATPVFGANLHSSFQTFGFSDAPRPILARAVSPNHNLTKATEKALWGKTPDISSQFKLAPSRAAAIDRAVRLAKEVRVVAEFVERQPLHSRYAPGVAPVVSKKIGKRKMKHSGSIYLKAADNNTGARTPYADVVKVWLVLDAPSIQLQSVGPFDDPLETPLYTGGPGVPPLRLRTDRGNVYTGESFLNALPTIMCGDATGSALSDTIVYEHVDAATLHNLYNTYTTLLTDALCAIHLPAVRHVVFFADRYVRQAFYEVRWLGLWPRELFNQETLQAWNTHDMRGTTDEVLIVVQEDLFPHMFIVEHSDHIKRSAPVTDYALFSNPEQGVRRIRYSWVRYPNEGVRAVASTMPNELLADETLDETPANASRAARVLQWTIPQAMETAEDLEFYRALQEHTANPPSLSRQEGFDVVEVVATATTQELDVFDDDDDGSGLRRIQVVETMVEGRSPDWLSPTFRDDLAQFHSTPLAVGTEVPCSTIEVLDDSDEHGVKQIAVTEITGSNAPWFDHRNPTNSTTEECNLFDYNNEHLPTFAHKIKDLEAEPTMDELTEVMQIYEKFRKGDAEPPQVLHMLTSGLGFFHRPHHATSWKREHDARCAEKDALIMKINELEQENKRLRGGFSSNGFYDPLSALESDSASES